MSGAAKQVRLDPIREAKAAAALRESIIAMAGEDEELIADSIEGETSLFELIDGLLASMAADEAFISGLEAMIDTLKARKERFAKRIETSRELITQALAIAELPKVERPSATLTIAARAPAAIVTDEAAIPSTYFKAARPTLDKKALTDALRARAKALRELPTDEEACASALACLPPDIPGATLSNAAPSLTIRRA